MSSSPHIDNKKKDILFRDKGPTQWLEHILTAEKLYSINFTKENVKKFYLLMVPKLLNLNQKILKLLHLHSV